MSPWRSLSRRPRLSRPLPTSPTGPHVKLEGGKEAINFVSFNFLGLAGNKEVEARVCVNDL